MNESELRKEIGIGEKELVNTNRGSLDIFSVSDGRVTYGLLAEGKVSYMTTDKFLENFK
jgi:hypothetical protein